MIIQPREDGKVHYRDASKIGDVYQNAEGWWIITKLHERNENGDRRGEVRPATQGDLILERLTTIADELAYMNERLIEIRNNQ